MQKLGIAVSQFENREAELALIALANYAAEKMRDELLAVTDAKYGGAACENGGLKGRARIVVDARRSAGDDDAARGAERFRGGLAGKNSGGDAKVPNLTGDQMAILTARIENGNLGGRVYFCILSTRILWALSRSPCALGMASTAASTSGSVLISN